MLPTIRPVNEHVITIRIAYANWLYPGECCAAATGSPCGAFGYCPVGLFVSGLWSSFDTGLWAGFMLLCEPFSPPSNTLQEPQKRVLSDAN